MVMKVLLNGATGGTNFGDFLFARIFHDEVSRLIGEENVFWYDSRYCLSEFYKRHLGYTPRKYKLKDIDALVCISGGYFCGDDKSLRDYIIRYLRYFHLCMRCIARRIPIAIIGLEVAKPQWKPMEYIERFILRRATVLSVRNTQSFEQLKRYGIDHAFCTVDTAHTITPDFFEESEVQVDIRSLNGKKLFFHVQPSAMRAAKKVIPVINRFIAAHPEYSVVIGADQYTEDDSYLSELACELTSETTVINHYDDPVALCKVLNAMDLIVTPKLHVGIVGATLSKSVVSFSVHTEKIARFYHQLEEDGRSLSMADFSEEKAMEMLEKYHDTPINVKTEIINAAQCNLECLRSFLTELPDKEG